MEMKIDQELLNELDAYPLNAYLEDNLNRRMGCCGGGAGASSETLM